MAEGLTTIHLGGKLGQRFGKKWELRVTSVAEAIRAIDINMKGELRRYLSGQGTKKFYKVAVGKKNNLIDKQEFVNRSGQSDIYILPTVRGANSGWGKILTAAVILAVSIYYPPAAAFLATHVAVATAVYTVAASLALGGITQLLAPNPNFNSDPQGDSRGSNIFGGNTAVVTQGGAVGVVYGRAQVSPMPICISFNNEDTVNPDGTPITTDVGTTTYTSVTSPGGGYQWDAGQDLQT